jgi:galactokinase
MFKNLVYSAAVTTTLFAQATVAEDYVEVQKGRYKGEKIIIIDTGSESKSSSRDIQKRVYRLEQAVRQLQERIFELELENDGLKDDKVKKTTCYLKTTKGVFSSTQKSMTQARAEAMQKCTEVVKFGFECDEDKVKCGE